MAKASEEISKYKANSSAKPDSNIANDSLHLGGIDADEYATKDYVQKYHNTKEEKLKQDISNQDKTVLEEAKAYSDEIVKSQDFSGFAKVTDVQAIDDKLSQKISNQGTEQKNYTDGRIQSVVNDVNTNFDNVGKSIESLNNSTNQLFQSVSDGKSKVAAAITDKGVDTASNASFDDMANNIKNISSSGGDIPTDPNFVNTGDATAEAKDIKAGKIAYAQGNKIYGTYVEKDPSTGVPTYGTDTSGATATSADIAMGKTAWANGVLLTGNAIFDQSTEVEEIYGASNDDYTIIDNANVGITKYPDTEDEVTQRFCMAFSKDTNYCVSAVRLNGSTTDTDYAIESHIVTDEGLQIQGSNSDSEGIIYKKYRYTKEELGLGENEVVKEIALGAAGVLSQSKDCLLMIRTTDSVTTSGTTKYYLHFYTYHLNDNGVIGKAYANERYIIDNYIIDYTDEIATATRETWSKFIFSNQNPTSLIIYGRYENTTYKLLLKKLTLSIYADSSDINKVNILATFENSEYGFNTCDYGISSIGASLSLDDKIISTSTLTDSDSRTCSAFIELNESLKLSASRLESGNKLYMSLSDTQLICCSLGDSTNGLIYLSVYNKTSNLSNQYIDISKVKGVYSKYDEDNLKSPIFAMITQNKDKLIVFLGEFGTWRYVKSGTLAIAIFNIDDIINAEDGAVIEPIQKQPLTLIANSDVPATAFCYATNYNMTRILFYMPQYSSGNFNGYLCILNRTEDRQKLLGVKYKNQFFAKTE